MWVSSCSSGSNTNESPVTQKESFRRVRRGPACVWRGWSIAREEQIPSVDGRRTWRKRWVTLKRIAHCAGTFFLSATNRSLAVKGFELHTLTGADVVMAGTYNGHLSVYRSSEDLEAPVINVAGNYEKKSAQEAQNRPSSSPSGCDRFSPRLFALNFAAERWPRITINTGCHANASRPFQANQDTAHTCRDSDRDFSVFFLSFFDCQILFFVRNLEREKERGGGGRQTHETGVRLIALKTLKIFVLIASAFWLASGNFQ